MLIELTQGYPVSEFTYDAAGQMIRARVFTQTTEFVYNGLGDRIAVNVAGHGATTYALDYAARGRILADLYDHECLGEQRADDWLYYLPNAEGRLQGSQRVALRPRRNGARRPTRPGEPLDLRRGIRLEHGPPASIA